MKETTEKNRTRDMEIRNKLTVTRGDGQEGKWRKKGEESSQGTCMKDP